MGKEIIEAALRSTYGGATLLGYSESEADFRFQLPTPLADPQSAKFRSAAAVLNDLAICHRLAMLTARGKCGIPEDFGFAIGSIETSRAPAEAAGGHDVSLSFEILARRHDKVTAVRSIFVTRHDGEARRATMAFNVLPPSLLGFLRRGRQFADFADVKMRREESELTAVAQDHFRYHPSEEDRLSDGRRVDHVPALILIDLALFVAEAAWSDLSAEFLNYTDPRLPFDILLGRDAGAVEFVQREEPVAIVRRVAAGG